jgi:hypothetical protein
LCCELRELWLLSDDFVGKLGAMCSPTDSVTRVVATLVQAFALPPCLDVGVANRKVWGRWDLLTEMAAGAEIATNRLLLPVEGWGCSFPIEER